MSTYWIVDPDARVVEVWRPEDEQPAIVSDVLRGGVAPGAGELGCELARLSRSRGERAGAMELGEEGIERRRVRAGA